MSRMLPDLPDDHDINHLRGALRILKENIEFNVAIDGGAHRGIWTSIFAERFKCVYAFEPMTENFIRIPDFDNVNKINCALGNEEGTFCMAPGKHNTGQWHIGLDKNNLNPTAIVRLDSYNLSPDLIKLDIEGFELLALKGAEETIKRSKPAIMVEMNGLSERYDYTDDDLRTYLSDFGYREVGKWNKDYLFLS